MSLQVAGAAESFMANLRQNRAEVNLFDLGAKTDET